MRIKNCKSRDFFSSNEMKLWIKEISENKFDMLPNKLTKCVLGYLINFELQGWLLNNKDQTFSSKINKQEW